MNSITARAHAYVASGLASLLPQVTALSADIRTGDLAAARSLWLTAHLTWERLGSAYGMFGSYDDEIDGTPFGLADGVNDPGFTGFYRLEYGLWHGQSAAEMSEAANQLTINVRALRTSWPGIELPATQAVGDLALRTHEILEDAMQNQLSGLDDFGSGTTLATVAAGIDATRAQLGILRPYLTSHYPQTQALYSSLDQPQRLVDGEKTSTRLDVGQQAERQPARATGRCGRTDGRTPRADPGHLRAGKAGAVSERDPAPANCPARPSEPGRRSFLRGVLGAGAVGATAGVVAGGVGVARAASASPAAGTSPVADPQGRLPAVPFHGVHQAGILPPPQRQTIMLAFDVTTGSRGELTGLLRTLTERSRFLTSGGMPVPAGPPGRRRTRGSSGPRSSRTG